MSRKAFLLAVLCGLLVAPALFAGEGGVEAASVFEQLKGLSGTWRGTPEAGGAAAEHEGEMPNEAVHEFEVSAAGTVVMETMAPGTDHEMINMYHLDGDELLLTHYCAAGNQPVMRLNREASTGESLVFDFVGGTNLDPAVDHHIHAAKIELVDADTLNSAWSGWSEGKPAGSMTFYLSRDAE